MPPRVFAIARSDNRGVVERYENGLELQEMSTVARDVGERTRRCSRDLDIDEADLVSQ